MSAPYATAVFKGDRLTQPRANDPRTRIWFLLYAQVTQADGSQQRNILLTRTLATPEFDMDPQRGEPLPNTRDIFGVGEFIQPAVEQALADRALPLDAPLSVIAVELLPGDLFRIFPSRLHPRRALHPRLRSVQTGPPFFSDADAHGTIVVVDARSKK